MINDCRKAEQLEAITKAVALRRAEGNEEQQWEIIHRLHKSGSRHVLKRCIAMCKSGEPAEREVAADILGQLGWSGGEHPFRDESITAVSPLLKDRNEQVVDAAVAALGHMRASEAILRNMHLAEHSSELIRFSMARCLGLIDSPKARRALITLSTDEDPDIRNWAVFGLGTQCDNNTKEIRAALFARIDEEDEEIRNEAILGLARRKVREVIPVLVRELNSEPANPSPLALEAAHELLAKEFLKPLQKIMDACGDENGKIQETISAINER